MQEKTLFVCACESLDHHFVISRETDDEDSFTYLLVHLTPAGFFTRLTRAIRYLFGQPTTAYDEIVLRPDQVKRLVEVLDSNPNTQNA